MTLLKRKAISLILVLAMLVLQILCLSSCMSNDPVDDGGASDVKPETPENGGSQAGNGGTQGGNTENGSVNENIMVRFITEDGIPISISEIKKGESVTSPTPPRKIGYIFTGWNGDYTNLTKNTDIIATYEKISDKQNVIVADTVYAKGGSEFSVLVGIYGNVSFCGLDMNVAYDSNALQLIGVEDVDDSVIQNSSESGIVNMNYVTTSNTTGDVAFMTLKFKAKTAVKIETGLEISVNGMYTLDGDQLVKSDYQVIQNKIIIEET